MQFDRNKKGRPLKRDVWIKVLEMKMWRNDFVLESQNGLDQSSHPGHWFGVANIGLDGTESARTPIAMRVAIHRFQSVELNWIPKGRPGAVGLYVGNRRRIQPGI